LSQQFIAALIDTATTFFPSVVDTGQKKPKSQEFIACVNNTAEKAVHWCQQHTLIRGL
jgi:hypothetical protein